MRTFLSTVSVFVLCAVAAGCGTGSEGSQSNSDQPSSSPTTEAPAPEEPAEITFTVPPGFDPDTEGGAQYILGYPNSDVLYRPLEDAQSTHRIYIVSYLLPDEYAESDYEKQAELVKEYDELSSNTAAPKETTPAITGGHEGAYRYAKVLDWWDEPVEQHNFFVFEGQLMAQIICQWKDDPDGLLEACQTAVRDFEFVDPGEDDGE